MSELISDTRNSRPTTKKFPSQMNGNRVSESDYRNGGSDMVTDKQVRDLMALIQKEKKFKVAAAKAGMDDTLSV